MTGGSTIFLYCERGLDAGALAEPLNALSNVGFFLAAILAGRQLRAYQAGGDDTAATAVIAVLIGLTALIGAGSLLFHVLATRWAQLADVIPIGLFMVAYLAFALRVLLGLGWLPVMAWSAVFALAVLALISACWQAGAAAAHPLCLNGTLCYAPALVAMAGVGMVLRHRGHPAAARLLGAAALFAVSMAMRSADVAACEATRIAGHAVGLHVLWHLLNAAVLYLLLTAAVKTVSLVPRCQDRPDAA